MARRPSWARDWASASSAPSRSSVTGSCRVGSAATRSSTPSSAPPKAESVDSETRSLASVVRASRQPPSTSPTTQSSGTKHPSKNTSLNRASPVISRRGRTSMPGDVHVDQKVGDAPVLGNVGIGPGQADAHVGAGGHRGPHLLAVERPAPVHPGGPGAEGGQVGTGPRLAEQLAPDDVAAEGRGHPALGLFGRPVGHDGREGPRRHGQVGPTQAGLGADLVDDQLLHGPGVPTQRRRPVRGQQTFIGQGPALFGRILDGGDGRHDRRQLPAEELGLGRQLEAEPSASTGQGQPGRLRPAAARCPRPAGAAWWPDAGGCGRRAPR